MPPLKHISKIAAVSLVTALHIVRDLVEKDRWRCNLQDKWDEKIYIEGEALYLRYLVCVCDVCIIDQKTASILTLTAMHTRHDHV